ncbi:hypothetical protein JDV02_004797 [Purpureocillium takamizusanense]|uniref:Cytochrome b561 domain-containing protein n=1 Tax=Purpureocillium takamizusanense TaxID=2060973 RepID=A0A9Q8QEK9_9HYPO|nr:uncharacterized protein JDV02_004797 [Purpureocillium takamizusanense]UNI18533.1 hypothetical protein JDV02_004797 [Purpureocillium takamizusanense]
MTLSSQKPLRGLWPLAALLCLALPLQSVAEPVQYCKSGHSTDGEDGVDFCVGLSLHRNASTDAHNAYITLTHTRPSHSAVGWTAVGIGRTMMGALMFVMYGDPAASGEKKPTVSVRTATGHTYPNVVPRERMNGGDWRVMHAEWLTDGGQRDTSTAVVSLVCYSCTLWPDEPISASSTAQPWIWAWNKGQQFATFTDNEHLAMHEPRPDSGGYGHFYVDMTQAESAGSKEPSLPVIDPGVAAVGASDSPKSTGTSKPKPKPMSFHVIVMRIHGVLMMVAFLLLLPLGVLAIRSGSPRSFKYHWIIQTTASLAMAGGLAAGLSMHPEISTVHQVVGVCLAGMVVVQIYLGWRHHVDFVRIRRRTWISHAHIWAGRVFLAGGSVNVLLGLALSGYSRLCMAIVAGYIVVGGVGLTFWIRRRNKSMAAKSNGVVEGEEEEEQLVPLQSDEYFVVAEDGDDDESDDARKSTEKTR